MCRPRQTPERIHHLKCSPFVECFETAQTTASCSPSLLGRLTAAPAAQMIEIAELSALQRDTLIKMRALYLRNIGILTGRRQRLTAKLQASLGP